MAGYLAGLFQSPGFPDVSQANLGSREERLCVKGRRLIGFAFDRLG